jgi:basic membrane protein A and related proteins
MHMTSMTSIIGVLAIACAGALAGAPRAVVAQPLDVGFVYVSPIGSAGWTYEHEQGRRFLERSLGAKVRTRFVEGVPEGADSERVMREMASDGATLIFATSFGYLEPALRVAAQFPSTRIEHAGGHKTTGNVATYNARFYEARWLAGYLAGRTSKSGVAGYVAGFPVPEVIQGLNAFTLGMRAANPEARVRVLWLNAWFDPARERDAATTLVNGGADVLTNHSGSPAVPQVAQERGVKLVAYQSDMRHHAPNAQLAAIKADWGAYYVQRARDAIDQRWASRVTWGGMREGMVDLVGVDPSLADAVRRDLEQRREALLAGRDGPFFGRLVDQAATVRQSVGSMSDRDIAGMDWLVQGVVGTLPGSGK